MSEITHACLRNLIGISETDCECYSEKPEDFNTSIAGIYLDQLAPLNMIAGLENCEDGTLWEIYDEARTEGITKFIADINALLLVSNKLRFPQWKGKVGDPRSKSVLSPNGNFSVLRLYCRDIRSGKLIIKKIGTCFSQTGTCQVGVYDNLGNIHGIYDLTTIANSFYENDITPLELPTHNDNIKNIEYYLVYANGANKPRDNKLACCGKFSGIFNPDSPYFEKHIDRSDFWARWVMVAGTTITDISQLSDRDLSLGATDYTMGLTVDLELKCETEENICLEDVKFEHPQLYLAMATCIRYKASGFAMNKLMTTDRLSRAIMINREQIADFKKEWESDYNKLMPYITENIDTTLTDCFVCKEAIEAYKKPLF